MTYLLSASVIVMLASLLGVLFVWHSAGRFIERNLHFLVSFSTGVFLVFSWQLGVEVFEHMDVLGGVLWMILGGLGVTLVCRWLPHRHRDEECDVDAEHVHVDAHRMLVSDSIHNVGDGVLLASAFAVSPVAGIAATVSVFIHESVQEIAEFFVLRDAGYTVRRALLLNFATSSTILVGALGGWYVLEIFEHIEAILLAVAAGGVVAVVFYDVLPHSVNDARTHSTKWTHATWFLVGAVVMFGVMQLAPHEHPDHESDALHVEQHL